MSRFDFDKADFRLGTTLVVPSQAQFLAASRFAEKLNQSASGAKARTEKKNLVAALKRCATQNPSFSATCLAADGRLQDF